MISNLQEKYNQLSPAQKDIFIGYGLRQIKHFVEISLPKIEVALPEGAKVQGINAEGKVLAYHEASQQYYVWISDLQWQIYTKPTVAVDLKEDAIAVWQIFNLKDHELINLSHIHRDFLDNQSADKE
ncbi:hypothetical protein C9E88_015315 [Acinetobacter cumulans]|uniref:hypothetical protein n=1 Tax=Acinetobacter cumulans TaxID=2136182 RepID=UPI000D125855|nr:hypothetical protein [Acinetobacter cumulans]QCO22765.1 hypothetical protein C9E88_015315 [Acinetobacter cumulans]RKG48937.1 hypothetical protein D7V68_07230 [Acinetobacter cumulans]